MDKDSEITFYDSVTGKPLFIAPRGRSFEDFRKESVSHGWPSFRDQEVRLCCWLLLVTFFGEQTGHVVQQWRHAMSDTY